MIGFDIFALWYLLPFCVCAGIIFIWVKWYEINYYSFFDVVTYLRFFPVLVILCFIVYLTLEFNPL
jgi:hypothetical protein